MDRAKVNNCGDESGILVRELILYFVTFFAPEIKTEINSELNPGERQSAEKPNLQTVKVNCLLKSNISLNFLLISFNESRAAYNTVGNVKQILGTVLLLETSVRKVSAAAYLFQVCLDRPCRKVKISILQAVSSTTSVTLSKVEMTLGQCRAASPT